MTRFLYRATHINGRSVKGTIEAQSQTEAVVHLSAEGLYPIELKARSSHESIGFRLRPSAQASASVFRSLALFLEAGMPLQRALEVTAKLSSGSLREALLGVGAAVREGKGLAAALAAEPHAFEPVTVGLVRAGEQGLGIGRSLEHAADHLEYQAAALGRLRGALAYPAVLVTAGLTSIVVLTTVVVPRFQDLFGNSISTLPASTRLLLSGTGVVQAHGAWLGCLVGAGLLGAVGVTSRLKAGLRQRVLDVPIVGPLCLHFASARICKTLSVLLDGGVSAGPALGVTLHSAGNNAVAERLRSACDLVAQGSSLSEALKRCHVLSEATLFLLAVGEETGRLPVVLAKAARAEQEVAERQLRGLIGVVEPAVILWFALFVAFVAAALLQGVYSLGPAGP